MTAAGQDLWSQRDAAFTLKLDCCPLCRRPLPLHGSVFDQAIAVAEDVYRVSRAAIAGPSSTKCVSTARALVVWALRSLGRDLSYHAIGRLVGGRHHSTVVSLHQKAIALRLSDAAFADACREVAIRLQTRGASHANN